MSARLAAGLCVLVASVAVPAGAGAAWFPGPEIVSVDNARQEQGDGPTQFADISADGRYVVLQTRATNFFPAGDDDPEGTRRLGGVFRYDRRSGAIDLVAEGDVVADDGGALRVRGATNPSVSADGSKVAFSTAQRLVPGDANENVDVYVRDMNVGLAADRASTGAYRLVSALDATDVPPAYEPREPPLPGATPGANVFPGTAISADGRFVAFRTLEQRSDLAGGEPLSTPAGAVFVRDVTERRTTLVSRARGDGTPVGGSEAPVVLSADGSTVAWVGGFAPAQTRFLEGEGLDDGTPFYLWRRWADLGATTRRITGLVDLDDPGCPADGRVENSATATGPCYGALTDVDQGFNSIATRAPAMSGDGYQLAFLSGANRRPQNDGVQGLDLFLTNMRPGQTRKASTRQLTADSAGINPRANGEIESVAMSDGGRRLAFTSVRSAFILGAPRVQGAGRAEVGPSELYTIDLATDTLERVAFSPGGGEANASAQLNPTVSADGNLVAFTTRASNLLIGDANEQADAFVAAFRPPAAGGGASLARVGRPQSLLADAEDEPEITLRASRRNDGSVALRVRTPLAGRLEVTASTRARPKPPRRRAPKSSRRARRVARAVRTVKAGSLTVVLRVNGRDGRRIKAGSTLTADVVVRLTPSPKGPRLTAEDEITFRGSPARQRVDSRKRRARK